MADEGFHEIQLNGKQLVFLFMAATVISVVIFLCGVMVGRGVQTARAGGDVLQEPTGAVRAGDPAPSTAEAAPSAEPPAPAESASVDDDDYYDQLVGEKQNEPLKTPARQPPTKTAPAPAPSAAAVKPEPRTAKPESDRLVRTEDPTSSGRYAVQLAALRERNEAEAIAKRLVAKGYQAYVLAPAPGAPPVYRVQVGRFQNRSDADRTAARLRKEEQFTPWVTR